MISSAQLPCFAGLQMESQMSVSRDTLIRDLPEFSLVAGGPMFRLLRRARLTDDQLGLVRRRIVVISLLTWLPLLLLSALQGKLLGGSATVPFLLDMEVHSKFLIAVPLLIAAELVMHR